MREVLVKICGIRRIEDARVVAEAGADFIGMIFASSARQVDREGAKQIARAARAVRPDIRVVGVFVNEDPRVIARVADEVGLDLIQYHGEESVDAMEQVDRPSIRALRVGTHAPSVPRGLRADWILFDTFSPDQRGGTGERFDWSLLPRMAPERKFFLSGGLDPETVREAIEYVKPHAVDVSSGVESEPGVKDREKIAAFIRQVRS
jgi:phosphoribosylanthranilate isomerase